MGILDQENREKESINGLWIRNHLDLDMERRSNLMEQLILFIMREQKEDSPRQL
jgi:hypothetical protein